MDEVRIAIVGMGIGRPNAMALDANRRGRVVALCDLIEDRMTGLAKSLKGSVKTYTDYKAVCQASDVDAVFVGTPNQWHVPVGLEAVRNGKHVLVTKPLADSETTARQLVDEAEDSSVVNMMSLGIGLEIPASIWVNWLNRDISESSTMPKPAVSAETESQSGEAKINSV